MSNTMKSVAGLFCILFAAGVLTVTSDAALSDNYYQWTCPTATAEVAGIIITAVIANPGLAPQLLRLHFHDCFVRGCDASILIVKDDHTAEMDAPPNLNSLKGFDIITQVKAVLESICPQTVSCADIVALAARDALAILKGGNLLGPYWDVPLGRKDGNVSNFADALTNLPPPTFNYTELVNLFATKNLTAQQMVALSGAHTIGTANCTVSNNRLYNFTGVGDTDPSLDPTYAAYLKNECPQGIKTKRIAMKDQTGVSYSTNYTFDNYYFTNVKGNKGLFTSDAALITNTTGANQVNTYSAFGGLQFALDFRSAMVAMGAIGYILDPGHVRKNCSDANS